MATMAAALGEKELFYEITNAAIDIAEKNPFLWGYIKELTVFSRQLAEYGDKDHPLHGKLEELGITPPVNQFRGRRNGSPELLVECAVNRAILGDHVNARRLLKTAIEIEYESPHKPVLDFCPAIIKARSYEKRL